jgi:hypothetical protein
MKFAIKQEIKGVLGVLRGDASKVFVGKPSDALELVFDQKSGIYCYSHGFCFAAKVGDFRLNRQMIFRITEEEESMARGAKSMAHGAWHVA